MTHRFGSNVAAALLFLVVISILASHTYAIKCYVCGENSASPFAESTSVNQSLVRGRIQSSCDGFDASTTPQEREKYAFECPPEYKGCSIVVGGKGANVVRTCFQFTIEDCKNFNSYRYCYCSKDLCNNAENIGPMKELLGQPEQSVDHTDLFSDDEDSEDENGDEDEESGDYEEFTSREHESTTINKIISKVNGINHQPTLTTTMEATTTELPTVNQAVKFNLPVHFLILMSLINISIVAIHVRYSNLQ